MEHYTTCKDLEAQSKPRDSLPTIKTQLFPSPSGLINLQQTYSLLEGKEKRVLRRNSRQVDSKTKSSAKKTLNCDSSFLGCGGILLKEVVALRR